MSYVTSNEALLVVENSISTVQLGSVEFNEMVVSISAHDAPPSPPDPLLPYEGNGYISGLTKVNDVIYFGAMVSLFAEDNFHVSDAISDENGIFTFTGINESLKYFVVCKVSGWEYRVISNVTPKI